MCAGLSLLVNIQQEEYVTEVGDTAGLILLVLPQNIMPFPEDNGILVSPGYATSVGITAVCLTFRISFLPNGLLEPPIGVTA